jgi:hypothetical protein
MGIVTLSSGAWTIETDPTSSAGNSSTKASGNMSSCPTGTVIRFQCVGTVYTLWKNGSIVSGGTWTDTGNTVQPLDPSRRSVGVNITGGSLTLDSWSGGDV